MRRDTRNDASSVLDDSTIWSRKSTRRSIPRRWCLTILCHPDPTRVGEQAEISGPEAADPVLLSRLTPLFAQPGSEHSRPLEHLRLSRKPCRLVPRPRGGMTLDRDDCRIEILVDQQMLEQTLDVSEEDIERGVVLVLADRCTLLLHSTRQISPLPPDYGLVGRSAAIMSVRQEIAQIADLPHSVLLLGESGTGKELVARAIYQASSRRDRPFVPVNMAAIPPSLAASELFGARHGAFTGAARNHRGYFQQAEGGTLFLDEIGETPADVQALLLRALDNHQIQPIGADRPQACDVRVISATDLDLESATESGEFRTPLLYRLSTYTIELPPLRERREDIGRLFFHFLEKELQQLGETAPLDDPGGDGEPWMSARLMSRLTAYDWPGNVRQLQNVVRELAIGSRNHSRVQVLPKIERLLSPLQEQSSPSRPSTFRDPSEVSESELVEALRAHQFTITATAAHLHVSRTSLYSLMKQHQIPHASQLTQEQISLAHEKCDGNYERMAEHLRVSSKALKDRLSALR